MIDNYLKMRYNKQNHTETVSQKGVWDIWQKE